MNICSRKYKDTPPNLRSLKYPYVRIPTRQARGGLKDRFSPAIEGSRDA